MKRGLKEVMKHSDPFYVQGQLSLRDSACVLCLRQRKHVQKPINSKRFLEQSYIDNEKAKTIIKNHPFINDLLQRGDITCKF